MEWFQFRLTPLAVGPTYHRNKFNTHPLSMAAGSGSTSASSQLIVAPALLPRAAPSSAHVLSWPQLQPIVHS